MGEDGNVTPKLVRDLMSVGVPTCPLETPMRYLAELMLAEELEAVIVLDEMGHAAGAVTRDELVKEYAAGEYTSLTAENIMRPDVPQVPPDIPLTAAAQIMQDLGVRALFLMHHAGGIEYPAAILTYKHLMRHIAAEVDGDLSDLGIRASRKSPLDLFIERRDEARARAREGLKASNTRRG